MTTLLDTQTNQVKKTKHYQTDQQLKYLHLEAEIDMLLQRMTTLKQRKELLTELASK